MERPFHVPEELYPFESKWFESSRGRLAPMLKFFGESRVPEMSGRSSSRRGAGSRLPARGDPLPGLGLLENSSEAQYQFVGVSSGGYLQPDGQAA